MPDHDDDVLGAEDDRRKLDQEAPPDEGPPVAPMASTYRSVLVNSQEDADRIASDTSDSGDAPGDGLGRPQPPSESTGQG